MLGFLCTRPKPWILTSLTSHFHGFSAPLHTRLVLQGPIQQQFADFGGSNRQRHHSSACRLVSSGCGGGAASIWHVIQPSSALCSRGCSIRQKPPAEPRGEGSWNVAWDDRPARWLHRPDSAWLLFGVCACLAPIDFWMAEANTEAAVVVEENSDVGDSNGIISDDVKNNSSADYKVTGVLADGRCLFRAIAHGACLRNGEEAPDENHQRELADELRAQVVDELIKRRKEIEWFIEEDFDSYIKRIQQPYVWGGEPELLMASHVLKTMISVFMIDRTSGNLVNIANYGEEYPRDKENPINVLFHGYGHYEILETPSEQSFQKVNM